MRIAETLAVTIAVTITGAAIESTGLRLRRLKGERRRDACWGAAVAHLGVAGYPVRG
ncbi:hypothetical protein [Fontibacillus sp. BL9]|uniref:hypothetical protein n=1 Tax=Fontibacillus sp. BL9 TaxID=3389971 RepID=UPI00397CD656